MTSTEWQLDCSDLKQRGAQLFKTGQWADCTFLVGPESRQMHGHKLILAMASPVFGAMFYGGVSEKSDIIPILDVQPEAFKSLLEYVYTDNIKLSSFEKACELCYAANKYIMPHLMNECVRYLMFKLNPWNVCRAYELAQLFGEKKLVAKCIQMISTKTEEVLNHSTFEEIGLNTLITLFSLENLNINSEMDLFRAAVRYTKAHRKRNAEQSTLISLEHSPKRIKLSSVVCKVLLTEEQRRNSFILSLPSTSTSKLTQIESTSCQSETDQKGPNQAAPNSQPDEQSKNNKDKVTIRSAIEKIRFLTLTPQEFSEGLVRSSLLTESEEYAIIMNIVSNNSVVPMPVGFSTCREKRSQFVRVFPPQQDIKIDDTARAEATFRYTIHHIRNLKENVSSPSCYVRNMRWKINVIPKRKRERKYLGFFLQCNSKGSAFRWTCHAKVELRLISHKSFIEPYSMKLHHCYSSKENEWGCPRFMSFEDVMDPDKGYMKDDAITLEVHLIADEPQFSV